MNAKSIPSRFVYSVDVPEITNLEAKFVYNYYVPNECIRDKDVLTDDSIKKMNVSQNIIKKLSSETDQDYLDYKKIPRYVKMTFTHPDTKRIPFARPSAGFINDNFDKIVSEEQFASGYYTAVNFSNGHVDQQTSTIFNNASKLLDNKKTKNGKSTAIYKNAVDTVGKSDLNVVSNVLNKKDLTDGTIFKSGGGSKVINDYFSALKTLNSYSQISNNVLHELAAYGSNNNFSLHKDSFLKMKSYAAAHAKRNNNFHITEDEFKTRLPYYKVTSTIDDYNKSSSYYLVGYVIEKIEIFPDGSQKVHDPIIINNPGTNNFIDFNTRYGTVYVYRVKSIMEATFVSIDDSQTPALISSLISSKPTTTVVETTENIGPPPPIEFKFVWDYDRINPSTAQFDPDANRPFPGTGIKGSLMLHWSFPINTQMDIKKFQVFRRKSINDPFELIKMFDFNDAIVVFPNAESSINPSLIEMTKPNPALIYFDDDFLKSSEYIYAIAAVDTHGYTSNYSEQFNVSFDVYKNKLNVKLISYSGAPKNYPNLHLLKDLFVDTMKTSNKKTMSLYLTPDCYNVKSTNASIKKVLGTTSESINYKINFINIENQASTQIDVNIKDLRPRKFIRKNLQLNFGLKFTNFKK
jgi:hypothetical protein